VFTVTGLSVLSVSTICAPMPTGPEVGLIVMAVTVGIGRDIGPVFLYKSLERHQMRRQDLGTEAARLGLDQSSELHVIRFKVGARSIGRATVLAKPNGILGVVKIRDEDVFAATGRGDPGRLHHRKIPHPALTAEAVARTPRATPMPLLLQEVCQTVGARKFRLTAMMCMTSGSRRGPPSEHIYWQKGN
jgi:hypothetical protein